MSEAEVVSQPSDLGSEIPTLQSERLVLRAMTLNDAPDVKRLAGDERIAATTILIPHPYPDGAAEQWIATHAEAYSSGTGVDWAITLRENGSLVGAINLAIDLHNERGEFGYWIGVPYWNNGYATEATALVIQYGFEQRGLRRIFAHHFGSNPQSGRVMQKLAMTYEGTLRKHIVKWDRIEDAVYYGMLREEFEGTNTTKAQG